MSEIEFRAMGSDAHARRQIRYTFHCERCGKSDSEL